MNDDLQKRQIRSRMEEKTTEELAEIWQKNDRTEWSAEAFEVIREILLDRLGELPPQIMTEESDDTDDADDIYHNPSRILKIASWAVVLSWFFLALGVVLFIGVIRIGILRFAAPTSMDDLISTLYAVLSPFVIPLVSFFFFVLLQAVAEGIYVLLDVERNTRHDDST
jgi:hypothetical protein